jgi:hypothetical protein
MSVQECSGCYSVTVEVAKGEWLNAGGALLRKSGASKRKILTDDNSIGRNLDIEVNIKPTTLLHFVFCKSSLLTSFKEK